MATYHMEMEAPPALALAPWPLGVWPWPKIPNNRELELELERGRSRSKEGRAPVRREARGASGGSRGLPRGLPGPSSSAVSQCELSLPPLRPPLPSECLRPRALPSQFSQFSCNRRSVLGRCVLRALYCANLQAPANSLVSLPFPSPLFRHRDLSVAQSRLALA